MKEPKPIKYSLRMKLVRTYPGGGRKAIWCANTIKMEDFSTEAMKMFERFVKKVKAEEKL